MTHLITDPGRFAVQAKAGFVAANRRRVRAVAGGVVRASGLVRGRVAVVTGGGSGHYPAFMGFVGMGMAAGAACGNIFASPSAGQIVSVSREVNRGAGFLLTFGNYTGDMLQFGLAAERLRSEGHDVRIVAVSDDIASAPPSAMNQRRGIAGGLAVYKVAGAAAEAGLDLDAVERLARRTNARTRTLGVAFSGCTLPGAESPLFSVPAGRMAVGLGVHGEPGLEERPLPDAAGLAELLVAALLAESPDDIPPQEARVVVVLNGLGGFKYEELFSLFDAVASNLEARGVRIVDAECGELVTSLEMAGLSLSLFWLDDELEPFWQAPADSAAFQRGHPTLGPTTAPEREADTPAPIPPASACDSPAGQGDQLIWARRVLEGLQKAQAALEASHQELGQLDAIAGDGDHGLGMVRGVGGAVAAAQRAVDDQGSVARVLLEAGEAWSEQGGGSSGALWGIGLAAAGNALAAADRLDPTALAGAVAAALGAIRNLGKAQAGDKTLVDALIPFSERLSSGIAQGESAARAWSEAANCAVHAAQATAELLPRLGRARSHGARSVGHPDPGAVSLAEVSVAVQI
ncbi:dihydroxyacetone kinase family protein [Synechococcus sp. CCY9202]|uniref:dihydroxyacetone kinase family protein n=1 Tax=Synechococcus sp. CCY9202 TaxID=174698 RepID=UPI002B1F4098|nr:dihydroxyacetone kinase family protein [Synechococcus sp. CCY9202]MEA5424826.1 dihydroxyacetone kinase family protein [Synechococcus sp. CCY9202]